MKKHKQNKAIAESLGWTHCCHRDLYGWGPQVVGYPPDCLPTAENECVVPDYTADLNAIHGAVDLLSAKNKRVFGDNLNGLVGALYDDYYDGIVPGWVADCFAHAITLTSQATAAQKAEAYLRTLGLWEQEGGTP